MKKLPAKRLVLTRDTVRTLATGELDVIVGGTRTTGGYTEGVTCKVNSGDCDTARCGR